MSFCSRMCSPFSTVISQQKHVLVQAFILCEFGCLFMPRFVFFGGTANCPQKNPKGGMNKHPNSQNIKACTLLKPLHCASITTKFCIMITTTKYSRWVVQASLLTTNPKWWTASIFENSKSPYLSSGLTNCHNLWRVDAL